MSEPLPSWRIVREEGRALVISIDMPDFSQAEVMVFEHQFGTAEMDGMIRLALANWHRTKGDVATPGGS